MSAPRVIDVHGISVRVTDDDVRTYPQLVQHLLDSLFLFQAFARWPDPEPGALRAPDADDPRGEKRAYVFGAPARRQALKALAVREVMKADEQAAFTARMQGAAS